MATDGQIAMEPSFYSLPTEIHSMILDYLGPQDILSLMQDGTIPASALAKSHFSAQDKDQNTVLHLMASKNAEEWMPAVLSQCTDVSPYNEYLDTTPLLEAVRSKHSATVHMFIKAGAEVSSGRRFLRNHSPLALAADNGGEAIMEILIDAGAAVDVEDSIDYTQPIHNAARNGHEGAVRLLLDRGADPSILSLGGAPIHLAAQLGHADVIQLLVRSGVNISLLQPRSGSTPLCLAVSQGQHEAVKVLLDNCAHNDISVSDGSGILPIHIAAASGYNRLMEGINAASYDRISLKMRDLKIRNVAVNTIDKRCSVDEFNAVLQLLINAGADINQSIDDDDDVTALHLAAVLGNRTAVELLVNSGADISRKTIKGLNTAASLAFYQEHYEISDFLNKKPIFRGTKIRNDDR